jgi:hypothetical protein
VLRTFKKKKTQNVITGAKWLNCYRDGLFYGRARIDPCPARLVLAGIKFFIFNFVLELGMALPQKS